MVGWSLLQKVTILILAMGCVGLAVTIYEEVTTAAAPALSPAGRRATLSHAASVRIASREEMPSLKTFSEVTERPLFSPKRRPERPPTKAAARPWSVLKLEGIIVTHDVREALLRRGTSSNIVPLREGQALDGWTIRSIARDRILIEGDGAQHELRLPGASETNSNHGARPTITP